MLSLIYQLIKYYGYTVPKKTKCLFDESLKGIDQLFS